MRGHGRSPRDAPSSILRGHWSALVVGVLRRCCACCRGRPFKPLRQPLRRPSELLTRAAPSVPLVWRALPPRGLMAAPPRRCCSLVAQSAAADPAGSRTRRGTAEVPIEARTGACPRRWASPERCDTTTASRDRRQVSRHADRHGRTRSVSGRAWILRSNVPTSRRRSAAQGPAMFHVKPRRSNEVSGKMPTPIGRLPADPLCVGPCLSGAVRRPGV